MKRNRMKNWLWAALLVVGAGMGVTACSKTDGWDDVSDRQETEMKKMYGDNCEWLKGVWVEESEKENPNANYVQITGDGNYTEVSDRVYHGRLVFLMGNVNYVEFRSDNSMTSCWYMDWADKTHTRLKMIPGTKNDLDYESTRYWIKLNGVPAGYIH